MNKIKSILFREIVRPLKITFSTSLGAKDVIKSILVKIVLESGDWGTGEIPTSFSLKQETIPHIKNCLGIISKKIKSSSIDDYRGLISDFRKSFVNFPMTISGLEVALFRAFLSMKQTTEHAYWGAKSYHLETDITIPFLNDRALKEWIRYILKNNFQTFKLKISGDVAEDKRIISSVYSTLENNHNKFILRLDGNQGYTLKTFPKIIDFIQKNDYDIELFEQPLHKKDFKGLRLIKRFSPIPIILDETVFTAQDLKCIIECNLADGVNIKIAKSGISESAKIIKIAKKHNLKLMIGCMTETMAGLSAAIYLSAGTGDFDFIDLDSVYFLHTKPRYDNIIIYDSGYAIEKENNDARFSIPDTRF